MFFSLLAGLLLAFAFQLLLTNLGVALGLSALGRVAPGGVGASSEVSGPEDSKNEPADADLKQADSGSLSPVSHLLGLGVTLTLASVLFATAFLSTTFSEISQFSTGLVFGLILWAAYLLVLIWISSITVSGILDFVLGTATAGIRRLFSTVEQVFSPGKSEETDSEDKLQRTIESLSSAINETLSEQQQLPALLAQQRETLLEEICDRTNLSPDQAESVLDSIQPNAEPNETSISTGDIETNISIDSSEGGSSAKSALSSLVSSQSLTQMLPNWRDLLRSAVGSIDTSDLDIETAWNTFQSFVSQEEAVPFNIVELDAEHYLREAPVYALQSETLADEFAERIYDPEADPDIVENQIQTMQQSDFAEWLQQRGDLTTEAIEPLTEKLKAVQAHVLERVKNKVEEAAESNFVEPDSAERVEASVVRSEEQKVAVRLAISELETKLISYFRYTALSKLNAQSVEEKLQSQIEELLPDLEDIPQSELELGFDKIEQTLTRRKGIKKKQKGELIAALESAWQRQTDRAPNVSLSRKVTRYLQSLDWSAADLEGFKDEVFQQVQSGIVSSSSFSQSLDASRLVAALSVPDSIKTDLLSLLKTESKPLLKRPRRWVVRAADSSQDLAQRLAQQLSGYLQHQDISEQPEKIVQGASAILQTAIQSISVERLPELDTDFWRQVIAQRKDLSSIDFESVVGELSKTWQATARSLPTLRAELKEQSMAQWQDVQSAVLTLTHKMDGDALDRVLEAMPNLDAVLAPTRQKFTEALDIAQVRFQQQSDLVAQSLQEKAEQVRHQVAIAAWWLFISLFASGAAAAGGGWLAVWANLR